MVEAVLGPQLRPLLVIAIFTGNIPKYSCT